MRTKEKIAVFWFRRDLRIHDNCGLAQALQKHASVLPIFIFDTHILGKLKDKDDSRVSFIHKVITRLKESFRKRNGDLKVFFGSPLDAFKALSDTFELEAVYANSDYEPQAIERDHAVGKFLKTLRVPFFGYKDQVIFSGDEIQTQSGSPFKVYTPYKRKWLEMLNTQPLATYATEPYLKNVYKPKTPFVLPALDDLGFLPSTIAIPPAELDIETVKVYDKMRDFPGTQGTTRLGIHLRFGTVSIRKMVRQAMDLNDVWLSELIWREFFMQILYNFPHVVSKSFRPEYDEIAWINDRESFERWCVGQTGYPIVDAGMRELNQTGFMHNRTRMIVASFLCKHLLTHWSWGEGYFARKLLDYDLSANNGNWQWAAGTGCDAAPYFRVFNPWTQSKKFDPHNRYICRWVPEYQTSDYPSPMVDHQMARERALRIYKEGLDKTRM